jgi:hypothetical protein
MAAGGPSRILMFVGAMMSFFYIAFGLGMVLGGLNLFDLNPTNLKLLGAGILAYGVFRLYLFIQRFRQMRKGE